MNPEHLTRLSEVEARDWFEDVQNLAEPKTYETPFAVFTQYGTDRDSVTKVVYKLDDQTYWYGDSLTVVVKAHINKPLHRKP